MPASLNTYPTRVRIFFVALVAIFLSVALIPNSPASAAPSTPVYSAQWGSSGSGDGDLDGPTGMAIDSTGNIWVADKDNRRIQKFTADGTYISQFGSSGSGNGEFNTLMGIAIDSNDNVFVTDFMWDFFGSGSYARVQKFNSSGDYLSQFGSWGSTDGKLLFPTRIAFDSSDNIFVVDAGNNRVQKFSSNGTYSSQFGSSGSGPGNFSSPSGIAIDSNDNIYVGSTGNDRIQKFDSDGDFVAQWGSNGNQDGEFNDPKDIYIDDLDQIYVVEYGNKRVQRFDTNGTFIDKFGSIGSGNGEFNQPIGITGGLNGQIYVSDQSLNTVQIFTQDWVPGAPTSLIATFGIGEAPVSWNAPASNGGRTITSYTVTSNPGGFTATTSTLSAAVTGLADGTSYTFTVTATNSVGTGPASSPSNQMTTLAATATPAPTATPVPPTSTPVGTSTPVPPPTPIPTAVRTDPAVIPTIIPSGKSGDDVSIVLPSSGGTFSLELSSSTVDAVVEVPPGALDSGQVAAVTIEEVAASDVPVPPAAIAGFDSTSFAFGSAVVDIRWFNSEGIEVDPYKIDVASRICLPYTGSDLSRVGGNHDRIRIWRYNEREWIPLSTRVYTDVWRACTYTRSFSYFAIGVDAPESIPVTQGNNRRLTEEFSGTWDNQDEELLASSAVFTPGLGSTVIALISGLSIVGGGLFTAGRARKASQKLKKQD